MRNGCFLIERLSVAGLCFMTGREQSGACCVKFSHPVVPEGGTLLQPLHILLDAMVTGVSLHHTDIAPALAYLILSSDTPTHVHSKAACHIQGQSC